MTARSSDAGSETICSLFLIGLPCSGNWIASPTGATLQACLHTGHASGR
jgi:hypothetical protein